MGILLNCWGRGDVAGDGGLLGQSTVGDGALSEACSFSVSAGTHEVVSTLSSSEETVFLISLSHDDSEKTLTYQSQRRLRRNKFHIRRTKVRQYKCKLTTLWHSKYGHIR